MQRELHRRVRLTKQQQLELCRMHSLEPTWSLAILGRWAEKQFALEKAPAKSSVKRNCAVKKILLRLKHQTLSCGAMMPGMP
ncbi:hypothetical protein GN244_ATG01688 [Phytophthora infestans]|uniref:ARS-binding protein 1 N-terminal domain-containing protein n=1 Tax=Phytophthora infestans TaxID=4787 RepID=A0A833W7S8_PHYIN|nr:hypothetical protein GN244_ATG01688 [Phytophthora infestans]